MKGNVFRFPVVARPPARPRDVSHLTGAVREVKPGAAALDLKDARKVLFAVGRGGTGKTTFLRWAIGEAMEREGDPPALAACDPVNRTLTGFFPGVLTPTGDTAQWMGYFLSWLMEGAPGEGGKPTNVSGALDMGGGDTALIGLVKGLPRVADIMEAKGLHPVLAVFLSPDPEDLTPLDALNAVGFQPKATLLVLNEGKVDTTMDAGVAFAPVRDDKTYQAALARGAAEAWMPRLWDNAVVAAAGLRFRKAATEAGSLGAFTRLRVMQGLDDMAARFAHVTSWLP